MRRLNGSVLAAGLFVLAVLGVSVLSGCAVALVGAGAVGGYAISRDTARAQVDADMGVAWKAAQDEVKARGHIEEESKDIHRLTGRVEGAEVTVTLTQMTASSVEIRVKVRKNMLPAIEIAQQVCVGIVKRTR